VKFVLTVGAVTILLLHMPVVSRRSGVLAEVVHAGGGLLVLLATTTLSVYKPLGRTRYGRRIQQERRKVPQQPDSETTGDDLSLGLKIVLAVLGVIVAVLIVLHLTGGGLGSHGH
jgi:hypothetical protein